MSSAEGAQNGGGRRPVPQPRQSVAEEPEVDEEEHHPNAGFRNNGDDDNHNHGDETNVENGRQNNNNQNVDNHRQQQKDDEEEVYELVNTSFMELLKDKIAAILKNHYHIVLLVAIIVIVALLTFSITGIALHTAYSRRISEVESTMNFLMDMQQPAQSAPVISGSPGPKGNTGQTGLTGAAGVKGIKGESGQKGDKGDSGAVGQKGETGETGAMGLRGPSGPSGPSGVKGESGNTGATGARGTTGLKGQKGASGANSQVSNVYTRWGRDDCPYTASLIYKGFTAGTYYSHSGGGSNYLCLPFDPSYKTYYTGSSGAFSYISGTEYESGICGLFPNDAQNENVPCARCHTARSSVMMIPAKSSCPNGWTEEYDGYLMTSLNSHTRNTFECVDDSPEYLSGLGSNRDGAQFYFVRPDCSSTGTIGYCQSTGNYVYNRQLTCVVCTK